jgi:hypothetical protein
MNHIIDIQNREIPQWVQILDKVAGKILLAGFLINRIKDIPMGPISHLLSMISIASYLLAYSLQILTSTYYDQSPQAFFNYSLLFQLQAICGAAASLMIIIHPSLWLPCLWLFVIANFCWYLAEQFRQQNPTYYPKMPSNRQNYLKYSLCLGISITCSAIMGTIAVFLPQCFGSLMAIGLALNYLATIIAFFYLFQADHFSENQLKSTSVHDNFLSYAP